MTSYTKQPFCNGPHSFGVCLSLTCVLACILFVVEYYYSFVYIYPILNFQSSLGSIRPLQNAHLPTHTRPSTPTARPGGQSQRKDPSLLMQCPFMQMPGVWHSSTSAQRGTEAVHYWVVDFAVLFPSDSLKSVCHSLNFSYTNVTLQRHYCFPVHSVFFPRKL